MFYWPTEYESLIPSLNKAFTPICCCSSSRQPCSELNEYSRAWSTTKHAWKISTYRMNQNMIKKIKSSINAITLSTNSSTVEESGCLGRVTKQDRHKASTPLTSVPRSHKFCILMESVGYSRGCVAVSVNTKWSSSTIEQSKLCMSNSFKNLYSQRLYETI